MPFLLVRSSLTAMFVVGVVALVISLAVSMRPTADQRPSAGENAVVSSAVPPASAVTPAPPAVPDAQPAPVLPRPDAQTIQVAPPPAPANRPARPWTRQGGVRWPRPVQHNIAGDGEVSISDVVTALGGHPVRVPAAAATAASEVIAHLPFVPSPLEWLHTARVSMVMDTSKAKTQLGWKPKYTSAQTLQALAQAV
jgi:UDP-glucose 4-epimerase